MIEVQVVDARDDAAFDEWFTTFDAARTNRDEPSWLPQEKRAEALDDRDQRTLLLLARLSGAPAGAAVLAMPLRDNQRLGWAELGVVPSLRRRGVGTALDEALEAQVRAAGRDTLVVEQAQRDDVADPHAPAAFARARGYSAALTEVRRDLRLPVHAAALDRLEEEAGRHSTGYQLRTWWDRVPEDLLDARAALAVRMSVDAPVGDLDWEQEVWDADRVRRRDEHAAQQGRTYVGVMALHAGTGDAAGFCEVGVPHALPERAYQWETLVVAAHRGRRLGLLMKVATTRELMARSPQSRYVSTWNAEVNAPMIAVNEQLGYRRVGTLTEWQRRLA